MMLTNILTDIHPVLRVLVIIILSVAAHFTVQTIRKFIQYFLTIMASGY